MAIKGKRVLIIEDVADQRTLARKILETAGLVVSEADSVDQALVSLAKSSPHLVLLDLQMPRKPGFAFLERKPFLPALASVPIIVTSGLRDKESVHRAIGLGASDYLIKPLNASILLQKIRKHLKDTEFQSFSFPESGAPALTISAGSEITKILGTSFLLESPIKICAKTQIKLEGPGLDALCLSDCFFVTDAAPVVRGVSGFYCHTIHAVGLARVIGTAPPKAEPEPKPQDDQ